VSVAQRSVAPATDRTSTDDLDHIVCPDCDPAGTRALCGLDVADAPWVDSPATVCVVCDDLQWFMCERCGA
jgi:hypothetical protein